MYYIAQYNTADSKLVSILNGPDFSGVDINLPNTRFAEVTKTDYEGGWSNVETIAAAAGEVENVAVLKRALKDKVNLKRFEIEQNGIIFSFINGGDGGIQTDQTSVRNVQALMSKALIAKNMGDDSTQFGFRDSSDVTHPMSASEVINLGLTLTTFINGTYQTSWSKKTAIDALTTSAEIKAYDISPGWSNTVTIDSTGDKAMNVKASQVTSNNSTCATTEKFRIYNGSSNGQETLPATTGQGRSIIFKNNTTFTWTLLPNGADTIDNMSNIILGQKQSVTLVDSSAGNWSLI